MRNMLNITMAVLLSAPAWADPPIEALPAEAIGVDGGRAIAPGRDGNNFDGFRFDFVDGAEVMSSGRMAEAGAVVLDFEAHRGWPDASVALPPRGNVLSSSSRDPFRPRGAAPLSSVAVASHRLAIAPAALDLDSETRTLEGMVTRLPSDEVGIYLVRDDAPADADGVTLSGVQGVIAAPATHAGRHVGMLITFDQPVLAAGMGGFNRSTAYGGDNNLELAAFDVDGQLLGRYRLPGGKTVDAGGKGAPMYVGLRAPDARPIQHLYVGHLHESSRNLVFDDLAFIPSP